MSPAVPTLVPPMRAAGPVEPMPQILRADARSLPLADASVDLVVTSPPYYGLRSYQDGGRVYDGQLGGESTPAEYLDALLEVTRECVRLLKPSRSIWVNLGDRYSSGNNGHSGLAALGERYRGGGHSDAKAKRARPPVTGVPAKSLLGLPWRYVIRCVDDLGLTLRAELVWAKPNALPESVTDRVRRSHETWFHFTTAPRYYAAVDEIGQTDAPASQIQHAHSGTADEPSYVGGKRPGSVWRISTQPLRVPADLGSIISPPSQWSGPAG